MKEESKNCIPFGPERDDMSVSPSVWQAITGGVTGTVECRIPGTKQKTNKSFYEIYEYQIDKYKVFANRRTEHMIAMTLCKIIAEVAKMPPDQMISVDSEEITAGTVAEVYDMLSPDQFYYAVERIGNLGNADEIKKKKNYLRTVLYNAFFEEDIDLILSTRMIL